MSREKFLELEGEAEKLVKVLTELRSEVNSYKTAGQELEKVREKLVKFISDGAEMTQETYKVVKLLQEAGGPAIFDALSKIRVLVIITLVISIISATVAVFGLIS